MEGAYLFDSVPDFAAVMPDLSAVACVSDEHAQSTALVLPEAKATSMVW